jgi:hypothetical protein
MSPAQQRRIASEGGRAAHANGVAHEWLPEEAKVYGAKGGQALVQKRGVEYMREIGRRGAASRRNKGLVP